MFTVIVLSLAVICGQNGSAARPGHRRRRARARRRAGTLPRKAAEASQTPLGILFSADVDAAAAEPAARGEPVVVPDRRVAVCGADARKPFTRRAPAGSTRTSDAKFAHAANVEAGMMLHLSSIDAMAG